MTQSISIFSTELLRVKNSFALWITVAGSLCIPILLFLTFLTEWQEFVPGVGENPWDDYLVRAANGCCFFAQITIVFIIGLIVNIEHDANGWKHIFVLPISKSSSYINKLSIIMLALVFFLSIYFISTLLFGVYLGYTRPELAFLQHVPNWWNLSAFILRFFVATLGIIAFQFWISFRLRNLAASMTIGMLGIAMGLLLKNWEYISYFPYSAPFLMLNYDTNQSEFFQLYHWNSICWFIFITALSFTDFTRRFNGF
ncbi:MAG: ABC transporter permease [Chryseolinea sp.]